jgi:molecular chaperone GrpE
MTRKADMNEEDSRAQEGLGPENDPDDGVEDGGNQEGESGNGGDAGVDTESEVVENQTTASGDGVEDGGGIDAEEETPGVDREARPEVGSGVKADAQTELESVQDELRRLRDQHLRLAADFENHRKRASADMAGIWLRAQADLVRSLVEGLDDLQRVSRFTSEDTTVEALIEGVDLVERNLLKALTEAGLKVLNPEGERFDPNGMEAVMRVPTEEEGQDETVHMVFQKGYMFKDQLVRPARVSVYKDDD